MIERGIAPSLGVLMVMMKSYGQYGNQKGVISCLDRMKEHNIKRSETIYSMLMKTMEEKKNYQG